MEMGTIASSSLCILMQEFGSVFGRLSEGMSSKPLPIACSGAATCIRISRATKSQDVHVLYIADRVSGRLSGVSIAISSSIEKSPREAHSIAPTNLLTVLVDVRSGRFMSVS